MRRDLVTRGRYVSDQVGMALGDGAQDEEGGARLGRGEHVQDCAAGELHAVLEPVPAVEGDLQPLVPVLEIDRHRIEHACASGAPWRIAPPAGANATGAYRLLIGARSATSLRSVRSLANLITTIPPGSRPVTTPSPNAG